MKTLRLQIIISVLILCWVSNIVKAAASSEETVYNFNGAKSNGLIPSPVIQGEMGIFYGSFSSGGISSSNCPKGCGSVFQIIPPVNSINPYHIKILHRFVGPEEGISPSQVIRDANGNLYGVTDYGGPYKCGTVFRLVAPATTQADWTLETLYSFRGGDSGCSPSVGLALDQKGVLYGATTYNDLTTCPQGQDAFDSGGDCGTVFRLVPPNGGKAAWTHQVIHSFTKENGGGISADLTVRQDGVVFGSTRGNRFGRPPTPSFVFALTPSGPPVHYSFKTVASFSAQNFSNSRLVLDASNNLFGTNEGCSNSDSTCTPGSVFRVSPTTSQGYSQAIIYTFPNERNGYSPDAIALDSGGNIFGATQYGGKCQYCGSVFGLAAPNGTGKTYTFRLLHAFSQKPDGAHPFGNVFLDEKGALIGTTYSGGTATNTNGRGIIYRVVP